MATLLTPLVLLALFAPSLALLEGYSDSDKCHLAKLSHSKISLDNGELVSETKDWSTLTFCFKGETDPGDPYTEATKLCTSDSNDQSYGRTMCDKNILQFSKDDNKKCNTEDNGCFSVSYPITCGELNKNFLSRIAFNGEAVSPTSGEQCAIKFSSDSGSDVHQVSTVSCSRYLNSTSFTVPAKCYQDVKTGGAFMGLAFAMVLSGLGLFLQNLFF